MGGMGDNRGSLCLMSKETSLGAPIAVINLFACKMGCTGGVGNCRCQSFLFKGLILSASLKIRPGYKKLSKDNEMPPLIFLLILCGSKMNDWQESKREENNIIHENYVSKKKL